LLKNYPKIEKPQSIEVRKTSNNAPKKKSHHALKKEIAYIGYALSC
jgi:hypothetical protein